jgi:4-hydroxybenzoate polyprenyltransferase
MERLIHRKVLANPMGGALRQYLRLGRIHSSVLLGMAAIFGALAAGGGTAAQLLALFAVGVCTHIYGFGLNELEDIEVDRASADLSGKPLVSGAVTPGGAGTLVFGGLAMSYVIPALFFPANFFQLAILQTVSIAAITVYDTRGKSLPYADFLLSTCVLILPVMGAIAVGGDPLAPLVLAVAGYAYIQGVVQNIIAGLKDAGHDASAGAKTTALRLGTRVARPAGGQGGAGRDGTLMPGGRLFALVVVLKAVQLTIALLPWYLGWLDYPDWALALLLLFAVAQTAQLGRVMQVQPFVRDDVKRRIGVHEMFTFMTAPVMLLPLFGIWPAAFLVFFPVLWLGVFLLLQYGELMADV